MTGSKSGPLRFTKDDFAALLGLEGALLLVFAARVSRW